MRLLPLALVPLFALSAHAARQDGLVAYFTFDDEANPLRNYAAPVPGKEPVEATKMPGSSALEPAFGAGRFGKAAEFNSGSLSNWALSLGKLDYLYEGDFTVAFWVNIPKANPGVVISNRESFVSSSPGWAFNAKYADHYNIRAGGASAPFVSYTNGIERKWRHVAYVVNRSTGTATIYLDGKKEKSYNLPSASAKLGSGQPTVVGASSLGKQNSDSSVDELGIWTRALAETEIAAIGDPKTDRRIPEASSYAWAGAGAVVAGLAALKRRHAKKAV